jgi:hypothetical protein
MEFKNDGATLGGETRFLLPESGSRSLEMCIYNKQETHSKRTKKKKTPTEGIFLRNSYPNFYADCLVASSFTSSTVSPEY